MLVNSAFHPAKAGKLAYTVTKNEVDAVRADFVIFTVFVLYAPAQRLHQLIPSQYPLIQK